MSLIEFLPSLIWPWLLFRIIKVGWRLLVALLFAALVSGCASTSNKFEKSPCACDFKLLNLESQRG